MSEPQLHEPSGHAYDTMEELETSMESISIEPIQSAVQAPYPTNNQPIISKSQKIVSLQNVFTESQKTAYVGLCYLTATGYKLDRLLSLKNKKAMTSYEKWLDALMERLYAYLDFAHEEQRMIRRLAEHQICPDELAGSLIADALRVAEDVKLQGEKVKTETESSMNNIPSTDDIEFVTESSDIRYVILSHLFILCIADGNYDARGRTLLKNIAKQLNVSLFALCAIEKAVAEQLRVRKGTSVMHKDNASVIDGNKKISKGKWALAAAATLGGGLIIGLTAGLAAPLIGAGIGAGLATIGVSGATGVGTFLGSTAGIAIITTGGVLTGGSMSGYKMAKRYRGLNEFEFLSLEDGMKLIEEHKEKRRRERRRRWKIEVKQKSDAGIQPDAQTELSKIGKLHKNRSSTQGIPSSSDLKSSPAKRSRAHSETQDVGSNESLDIPTATFEEGEKQDPKFKSTNVIITVAGWIAYGSDDYTLPFSTLLPDIYGDQYTLIWEKEALESLGSSLTMLAKEVTSFILQQGLQATLLPILMAGLSGPMWALKLTYFIDNPWGNALLKAKRAGMVMADTLIAQVQENRPVTLVGFSLGARVIYYCLLELAKKNAFGIVEEAYILGGPVMATKQEWESISSIVSGRVVNGYLKSDWVLGYLYKTSSVLWNDVAGLNPILDVPGVENIQLDDTISGHLEYRLGMPKVFQRLGFEVTSDYFDDEEEEEEFDKQQLLEELKKMKTEKQKAKDDSKRGIVEINGIQVKELKSTLPTLYMHTELDPPTIIAPPENLFLSKIDNGQSSQDSINIDSFSTASAWDSIRK